MLTFKQTHLIKEAAMDRTNGNCGMGMVATFSFLIGGAVGAGVALLMAPQSGKRTRRQIKDLAEDFSEQASDYADKMKKKIF